LKLTSILFYITLSISSFAQNYYAVELVDKTTERIEYFKNHPLEMLTQRAIDRRQVLNIEFNAEDAPIDNAIILQCKNTGAEILSSSKWLNTLYIRATENQKILLEAIDYVKNIRSLEVSSSSKKTKSFSSSLSKQQSDIYGESKDFVTQIKTNFLHENNFTGEGIQIAIFDAGFPGVNTTEPFKELRDRNGILGTYNFVENIKDVYRDNQHGTMVLSTMAVNKPNTYIGTSYKAKYWLFTTEDGGSETPKEEFNWIKAIEFADSVGVDVVNCSLGYYDFDLPFKSYVYADLDGNTTFISRAANIGGKKGIILVISAGNEGNKTWKYVGAPADAKNIISIGAVNSEGIIGSFSSYGPSADGRIKPDVVAMGVSVPLYNKYGNLTYSNGTSFSSPITAGSVACLKQAFPTAPVDLIISSIQKSASIYNNPDDRLGYGIANFEGAYNILKEQLSLDKVEFLALSIFPNPVLESFKIKGIDNKLYNYTISDLSGRVVMKGKKKLNGSFNISILKQGYYHFTIYSDKNTIISFIKSN